VRFRVICGQEKRIRDFDIRGLYNINNMFILYSAFQPHFTI